jgi:ectoine hydroxylase-related dioxygenase (phytanoyl-CoA dioxygenase family)
MWLPLSNISKEIGSMHFVSGSHGLGDINAGVISDESHHEIQKWIDDQEQSVTTYGAMRVGDATFHSGFTIHSAPANPSNMPRPVMTVIYVAEGTRILEPTPEQKFDLKFWLDGRLPGETVGGPLNPILYP